MRIPSISASLLSIICLAGCASTSFSPPKVNLSSESTISGKSGGSCVSQVGQTAKALGKNEESARILIDNFILAYRCAAHEAANGRQGFEVPSLLIAAGTVTAAAFGAGPSVAIAGGAGTALLSTGKSYYSPQQKAQFYDSALDALLCIKTEAVGVAPFETNKNNNFSTRDKDQTVPVSASLRYHAMVTAALFSVERILSQRLTTSGQFDPAGLIAEIEAVKAEIDKAKAEAAAPPVAQQVAAGVANTPLAAPPKQDNPVDQKKAISFNLGGDAKDAKSQRDPLDLVIGREMLLALKNDKPSAGDGRTFDLSLNALQPQLQKCVIRAKL